MKRLILILICFVVPAFGTCPRSGTTNTAASVAYADVNSCFTGSIASGDTVVIPAGTATWATTLSVTVPVGLANITIQGAASCYLVACSTVITTTDSPAFILNPTSGGAWRITNMGFAGNAGSGGSDFGFLEIDGVYGSIRLDHLQFRPNTASSRTVMVGYNSWPHLTNGIYGLMDHIDWKAPTSGNSCTDGLGLYNGADNSFNQADQFGTANAWYIEDSTFDFTLCPSSPTPVNSVMDGEHGQMMVFRHNNLKDAQIQGHDTGSTPESLGARLVEAYANVFTCSRPDCGFTAIQFRGGTQFDFDNAIPLCTSCTAAPNGYEKANSTQVWRVSDVNIGGISDPWDFKATSTQQKLCSDLMPHCTGGTNPQCFLSPFGRSFTTHPSPGASACVEPGGSGTCENNPLGAVGSQDMCGAGNIVLGFIDGTDTTGNYPALNQIGRGQFNRASAPRNTLRPVYWWNNTDPNNGNAQLATLTVTDPTEVPFVKTNRDVFFTDATNCPANASFATNTCSKGVGRGSLGQRPAHCVNSDFPGNFPGPGYVDSATNTLYVCTATDTWTQWYAPYTYPHPLQSVTNGGGSISIGVMSGSTVVK